MPVYIIEELDAPGSIYSVVAGSGKQAKHKVDRQLPEDHFHKIRILGTTEECERLAQDADEMVAQLK